MSIKTLISKYTKNISLRGTIKNILGLGLIVVVSDMITSPNQGIGKMANEAIGSIPNIAYMVIVAALVIWFGLGSVSEIDDKVKDMPFVLVVVSIIGTVHFTVQYMLTSSILPNNIFGGAINVVFGIITGVLLWFCGGLVVAGITMSILGIDPKDSKHKNSNTDDPYNDKHAEKILNQEDSQ